MSGIYFDASDIGSHIKPFGDNGVMVNGKTFFIPSGFGKLLSSRWQGDSLVLSDQNGNQHFFAYQGRSFVAYKGESQPHDFVEYNKALKESREARARAEKALSSKKKTVKKTKKKYEDSSKKKPFIVRIFKGIWWLIKTLVKALFNILLFIGVSENQRK